MQRLSGGFTGEGDIDPLTYLMENDAEAYRLEMKTDMNRVADQVRWAGLKQGMRVADVGCGPGKITSLLCSMTGPGGSTVGIDQSADRIRHAQAHYSCPEIAFRCQDILEPMDDLGTFDFVFVRFVLEYHRLQAFEIVRNIARLVKPGGILCLVDLDHNCLNQYGVPARLKKAIDAVMAKLEKDADFDPHMGIKLYTMIYDLNFDAIDVRMDAHHLIFGPLDSIQDYDWTQKVEVAAQHCGYPFDEYENGYDGFYAEFKSSFADPRRFVYTPVICCRGVRSLAPDS
jgi:2-polyprenyl-3-methyl-5-hydroxy-6-metoxy-1,4-benzoquinol methylase